MKNIFIAALIGASAFLPSAAEAAYRTGEMRDWEHPWGYRGVVSERGTNEWDSFAFDGPNGVEYMEVHCKTKDWKSQGYNANVPGFHDAVMYDWCKDF